jgi:formylglycine-generating enzyme required for sulfatase activity
VLFEGEATVPPSALSADKPARKNEAPTVSGMLRCESYPERAACELNTNCSWADNRKQCEKKSGGLATAMLEALPSLKPTSEATCAGVDALVGNQKRCLKPKDSFKDCPKSPEMIVVPAGEFMMGSPQDEEGREPRDGSTR